MSTPFIGTIQPFAFAFAPKDWTTCSGQQLQVSQNTALFSLIGTTYGGNGAQNFNLPDLRGRVAMGQGQHAGGANYTLGQVGGAENATLNQGNLPSHNHTLMALNGNATQSTPTNNVLATASGTTLDEQQVNVTVYAPAGTMAAMSPLSISSTGNSQPFSILPPYLAINYCIALVGLYPSRN